MKSKAIISNIKTSIMGTIKFDMTAKGHRGTQNFICYPITEETKLITIQSGKRIGKYDPETGIILLSKSRANSSYFHHLQMDNLTAVEIDPLENQELKIKIFTTSGKKVGESIVKSNNSGAINIFEM